MTNNNVETTLFLAIFLQNRTTSSPIIIKKKV